MIRIIKNRKKLSERIEKMRKSNIERNTFETKIKIELNIDGTGK